MEADVEITATELRAGLKKIRLRQYSLFALIIAYLPLMVLAMAAEQEVRAIVATLFIWIILLIIVVALMTLVRCPRCGNRFHRWGFSPRRRCFSCTPHLITDTLIPGQY